ncbi:unnamed protein product (macronuclear) [Paramecium tetraurelia]|uniref:Uncharacterized protein n=1 Tax=Paramecium tetraurelia TaxID=5888 RepID=A0DBX7_PARTE|nr:uncharacterized protein GSPATT00015421001 [Paramecium tetraurelia]CAK80544.1 unnamed protein product [Paramecium tetraurelia]|eukprot:XP_001447941.1 hypothetical protein (macronuclear) [Paramecium tetraurelia strain d4-2]
MDQVNAMQQYITKLKVALTDLQQKNKDLETKLEQEHKIAQTLEEKLEYTEKKLSNEKEQVEILGIKVDEYEKKLKSISDTKKPSFLGKVFNNSQQDQWTIRINQAEQSLDIQVQENEKLHAQVFTLKTQLELLENKLDEEQKSASQKFQRIKSYYQSEKTKREDLEKQIQQLNLAQTGLKYEISQLNIQIDSLKKEIDNKQQEISTTQQLLDKNQEDMKKLTQDLINQQQDIRQLEQEKVEFQGFVQEIQNYVTGLSIDQQYQELVNSLNEIIEKMHKQTYVKELFLQAKPGNYEIFKLAQEKILKLGKKNEQLIKQNKQLQDKLQVQKSKQE